MNKTFGVIGGDRRQAELARLLAEEGRTVWTSGVAGCPDLPAQAAAADVVILPLPLCREDGILNSETEDLPTSALFRRFSPGQLLLAGQVRPAQQIEAENCGLTLVDYFQREELTVANAAATAESALQIAMEHLDRTLLGMECLVLGFGRIGKLLAYRLHGWAPMLQSLPENRRTWLGSVPMAGRRWRPDASMVRCVTSAPCSTRSPRPSWATCCWRSCRRAACVWSWPPSRAST